MFLGFSLDLGPIQVQMVLRSPLIPSFYLCKAWVHKTLFEDYTLEPPRQGQPPNKGQKTHSQSVLCSEVQLYTCVRVCMWG